MPGSEGRFIWYELMTADMEAAKAFYGEVVGWDAKDASSPAMPYTLFLSGGTSVSGAMELSNDAREMGAHPSWLGYVGAADVDAAAGHIERLGGTVQVPPREIPAVSRFSIVADAQTAPLGLMRWLMPGRGEPPEQGVLGHVGWSELAAEDPDQALEFYGELFGWRKAESLKVGAGDAYQLFSAGGPAIGAIFARPAIIAAPFWLHYFTVADLDAAAIRVEARGGAILRRALPGPGDSWILHCMDPEGVMFGLLEERRRAASDQGPAFEVNWSSEWSGRSLKGRLVVTDKPPGTRDDSAPD